VAHWALRLVRLATVMHVHAHCKGRVAIVLSDAPATEFLDAEDQHRHECRRKNRVGLCVHGAIEALHCMYASRVYIYIRIK
jgi:hypothetical protein